MARLFDDVNNPKMKDLVGSIVSDPVTVSTGQPMFSVRDIEDEAWDAAYKTYPFHTYPSGVVPTCCLEPDGYCEVLRALFVDGYISTILGPSTMAAQPFNTIDMVVDPVHALADDHIRLAKPNRTRNHK